MKATLCDNCRTPSDDGPFGKEGWVVLGKIIRHENGHLPPGMPSDHPLAAMAAGNPEPHACIGKELEFCSDRCAAAYITNDYKPNLEALFADFADATPEDFATTVVPPPADEVG